QPTSGFMHLPFVLNLRPDDVLPPDLYERLHPRALNALPLEGVLVHHALLERAVQGAERIEDVVPEILPALVDRLAETLGHDPQKVLRLLLVLPFLDLLAALVFVDRLQRAVAVSLLLVDLQA